MNDDEESDVKSGAEVQKPKSIVTRRAGQKIEQSMKELALLKTMNLRLSIKIRATEAVRKCAGPPAKRLAEHQLTHTRNSQVSRIRTEASII